MRVALVPKARAMSTRGLILALFALGACGDLEDATLPMEGDTEAATDDDGASSPTTSVSAGFDDDGSDGGGQGDGDVECTADDECGEESPLCVAGTCQACDSLPDPDAACAGADPSAPICSDGACVQCLVDRSDACGGDTPICADTQCTACTAHDQCDVACELDGGACIDTLITVGPEGGFAEIGLALESIPEGESAAIVVSASSQCYLETLEITGARKVALLGADGPCLTSFDDAPALTVADDATLYLQDFAVEGAWGLGIAARGATVFTDRARIVNNQGGAVHLSQLATLHATNSVFGGDRNNVPAVDVDASDAHILYSTLAAGFGSSQALRCRGDGIQTVRNSIVVAESAGGEVDCPDAEIRDSALESAYGTGNVAVGPVDTGAWFSDFAGGDLHLDLDATEPMFAGVARWQAGDPITDIDGDPRPIVSGESDWCGADIP